MAEITETQTLKEERRPSLKRRRDRMIGAFKNFWAKINPGKDVMRLVPEQSAKLIGGESETSKNSEILTNIVNKICSEMSLHSYFHSSC